MKIDLSNVQYKQFVSFANRAKNSDFVQVGNPVDDLRPGELEHRKIVAKSSWDFVGNIGRGKTSRATNNAVRDLFKATILKMCGVTSEDMLPAGVRAAMKLDNFGKGKPLSARRIKAVDTALKAEIARRSAEAAPLAEPLGFKGKSGGMIAGFCTPGGGIPESIDPKAELANRIKTNGTVHLQKFAMDLICQKSGNEFSINADRPLDKFRKDFFRDAVVTIDGVTYACGAGKSTEQKEKAFEEVCDAFVKFITGDKNAKFSTASRDVKIQANVLMGFSMQGMDGCVMGTIGCSFDENPSLARFSFIGSNREWKHEFSKDEAGNIKVNYSLQYKDGITVNMEDEAHKGYMMIDSTGSGTYKAELTISQAKFSKFAKADWDNIDQEKVKNAGETESKHKPGWIKRLDEEMPEEFKLEFEDVQISYEIETNNLALP